MLFLSDLSNIIERIDARGDQAGNGKIVNEQSMDRLDPAAARRAPRSHRPKPAFARARRNPHAQPRLPRHGTLPRALALDGKYIRDLLLTLALSEHESGAPVAITIASKEPKSEASKTEGELTAAKRLYQKVDLRNAVVTGDALHCERENMQLVIENDGDFLFQLKGNQPTALTEPLSA